MTTLAEHIIVVGAENRPPTLEKSVYDSWASPIRLFIKGKKNGRMMLDSIDNGPLVYPTVEENRQTRPKKYFELTEAQLLQDDYDVQAKNIILHGLPPNVYALVNHQKAAKDIWDRVKLLMKGTALSYQELEDPIDCINKAMAFQFDVASRFPTSNNQLRTSSIPKIRQPFKMEESQFNKLKEDKLRVLLEGHMAKQCTQPKRLRISAWFKEKLMLAEAQEVGQILDEEQLHSRPWNSRNCDDISSAKENLMANLSSCDPDVLSKVPYSDSYPNDMINQDVQEMSYSEQTHIDDYLDNEINSDSNIIPYSQYLQESQDAAMHMLTKLQVFYDDTQKQALGYQNPFNLKKAQRIKPTLYDGSVITKEHAVILVIDDEETMILKEELNKIKEDFGKSFVTQKELYAEQAFWLKHSNYNPDTSVKSHTPVRIEAPSELPKVSLVNESLQNLKYQLASFDKVVKKRTTSDAIIAEIMSQEIVHIAVNYVDILDVKKLCVNECNKCLELETELLKKKDLIEKDVYDKLLKTHSQEKDTVIRKLKEKIKSLSEKDSVENVKKYIDEIETINIEFEQTLKNELRKLKGKNVVDTAVSKPSATISPGKFKLDIEPISRRLKNNRDAHEVYLEKTIENTDTLRRLVECTRKQYPSEPLLEFACTFTKHVQEFLVYVSKACPSLTKPCEN
ncbi:hypothetical protein Tco_0975731 [Tanacetum coccineum]|uniref:Integrase, catalytic region, zinc finger, CCHC-type, peptidase aspartic, catalytic n=1 Tax=Tanacetum coccineum TaxID=301880 RepID=A0ABQ5EF80_9ASTR